MSGGTWPKEEQRLCNGASGRVRASALDGVDAGAGLSWLCIEALDFDPAEGEDATPVNRAVDVADGLLRQSLDMAREALGYSSSVRREVLMLATAHLQAAATAYVAHERSAVLRELVPELAGAISEAGGLGASIFDLLKQALAQKNESHNNH